jgi:hypothetical protein
MAGRSSADHGFALRREVRDSTGVRLLPLLFLAACDLQPAPKKGPPAPPPAAATPGDAGTPTPSPGSGSAAAVKPAADAGMEVSEACVAAGTHLADIVIASATDVAQKAAYEQQRTQLVRKVAENCTKDWNDDARACVARANDVPAVQECLKLVKPATP